MPKVKEADIRDDIMKFLAKPEIDRDLTWLEKKTGLSYSHLYYIFVRKERSLTDKNRIKINEVLGTDF